MFQAGRTSFLIFLVFPNPPGSLWLRLQSPVVGVSAKSLRTKCGIKCSSSRWERRGSGSSGVVWVANTWGKVQKGFASLWGRGLACCHGSSSLIFSTTSEMLGGRCRTWTPTTQLEPLQLFQLSIVHPQEALPIQPRNQYAASHGSCTHFFTPAKHSGGAPLCLGLLATIQEPGLWALQCYRGPDHFCPKVGARESQEGHPAQQ